MNQPALAWHAELDRSIDWLLHDARLSQALVYYHELINVHQAPDDVIAYLGRRDRFFLLTHLFGRADAINAWLYARCREVEKRRDDYLDLWARDHYKSTIITFAGAIQEILENPEITIGIFSHTRPIAKAFQAQIQNELEYNELLIKLYPDVLFAHPRRESPSWSQDHGLIVRRQSNPKEKTVESWGLVDGQPTSKHFQLLIFDDVVTRESVTTPAQILKTTEAWELAQNLGSAQNPRRWHVGTRYNFADTYGQLEERQALTMRVYPATADGSMNGKPVFLRREVWEKKKQDSSVATIACQQLLNPLAGSEQELKPEWIRRYEVRPFTLNIYILCDYAGSRAAGSSNTAMVVLGVDVSMNKYILDGACHKMNLTERWKYLKQFYIKWSRAPGVQLCAVGYERFGAQSDIQHFETMMRIEPDCPVFPIEEVNWPRQGEVDKDNRIRRIIPDHQNWRFFYPYVGDETSLQREAKQRGQAFLVAKPIKQVNEERKVYDVIDYYLNNEYKFFPATTRKDFLDAESRIYDMDPQPPIIYDQASTQPEVPE